MDLTFQPPLPPTPEPPPREPYFVTTWGSDTVRVQYLGQYMQRINVTLPEGRWNNVETRPVVEEPGDELARARRKIAEMEKKINELQSRVSRAEARGHRGR